MKIAVVGTGYVGLVTGTCLADLGNDVICIDINEEKINTLRQGKSPIYEPGLDELLTKNIKQNRISFSTDLGESVKKSEVIYIAVGTPPDAAGKADLSAVKAVATSIGKNVNDYKIVITKSTVPVGTGDLVEKIIKENMVNSIDFDVISNPEFLKEGSALDDFLHPDRVVIGANNSKSAQKIKQIYEPLEAPIIITDLKSAEIIKYASNAFLSVKISFINEIANFCEIVGASVEDVARGMGSDSRIGPKFLKAGIGYGGSCFPKDTMALYEKGKEVGYEFKIVDSTVKINKEKRIRFLDKILNLVEKYNIKSIGIWGLAFKPDTDDMREAPSVEIIKGLLDKGITVSAYDPVAMSEAKHFFNDTITYSETAYDAISNKDMLVLLTEWNEFKQADFASIKDNLNNPIIIDGRNVYNPEEMKEMGFKYYSIGRNPIE